MCVVYIDHGTHAFFAFERRVSSVCFVNQHKRFLLPFYFLSFFLNVLYMTAALSNEIKLCSDYWLGKMSLSASSFSSFSFGNRENKRERGENFKKGKYITYKKSQREMHVPSRQRAISTRRRKSTTCPFVLPNWKAYKTIHRLCVYDAITFHILHHMRCSHFVSLGVCVCVLFSYKLRSGLWLGHTYVYIGNLLKRLSTQTVTITRNPLENV